MRNRYRGPSHLQVACQSGRPTIHGGTCGLSQGSMARFIASSVTVSPAATSRRACSMISMNSELGSCAASVQRRKSTTHALHHGGSNPLGVEHRLIGGHILGQVILMDPTERPQIGPQAGPGPFAAITVYFPLPVPVVIPRPLLLAVLDAPMLQLQFLLHRPVAAPLIGIQARGAHGNAAGQDFSAGHGIRMLAHEVRTLSSGAPDARA